MKRFHASCERLTKREKHFVNNTLLIDAYSFLKVSFFQLA